MAKTCHKLEVITKLEVQYQPPTLHRSSSSSSILSVSSILLCYPGRAGTMVYWFLSSFISATLEVLLEKLADFSINAYKSISDADEKLEKLRWTVKRVNSLICDAEEKQLTDMAWQSLLEDLENVAYDADDLMDEIAIKVSELERGHRDHKNQVNKLVSSLFKHTSAPNMSKIQVKLDNRLRELDNICQMKQMKGKQLERLASKLQTSSLTDASLHVFGRESDKIKIINMLAMSEESSSRANNVSIIPIVGVIGVGKTTLAQLVYNYDYQEKNASPHVPFHFKMWVSVTKDFEVMRLTRSIIEAATHESTSHLLNLDTLQRKLIELLRDKRFLLVLDDLWNVKRNEWNLLLKPLKHCSKGSKIIVTTGSHEVSSMVGTMGSYHLEGLSDTDCWSLLKQEALGDIGVNMIRHLEGIGMELAGKCNGLPLAAKILGSVLHSNVDENEWSKILESGMWELAVIKNEIVPALRSGYHHLPSHLRRCFAYCSMFPQRYDFDKDKILRMWMGEGFVIPEKERRMHECIASDYFDQLLWKSFLQMEGHKYKIPCPIHDLAQAVSGERFLRTQKPDDPRININTRHLSLVCEEIQQTTLEVLHRCKRLRTFLLLRAKSPIVNVSPALFMELGRLRVLDFSGTQIEELTGSVGNLKHLRFLDLSNTLLKCLPEATQELSVLQTLRLINCSKLLHLPKRISRLKSLLHLELTGCSQLSSMPQDIGKLVGLQTVTEFIVGPYRGQLEELKYLNNIRGSLCIKQLEKLKNPEEAKEANLANKKYLDRLELQWTSVVDERNNDHVLDKLMIFTPENLKELTITNYGGRMFPTLKSESSFSKLTSIYLSECQNCVLFPRLGRLPKLKSLKISGMHELTTVDEVGFQMLETLEFRDMNKLNSWVGVHNNDMPCLLNLTIVECPQMINLPSLHYFGSLEKLELENCPRLPSLSEKELSNSVESLIMMKCPMLKERYKIDGGEDWTRIHHIPYIEIDYKIVRELRPRF